MKKRDFKKAIEAFKDVVSFYFFKEETDPEHAGALTEIASILSIQGNFDKAMKFFLFGVLIT